MISYLSLFAASFLSATLLPGFSEVTFAGLIAAGGDVLLLWLVATAGNTLGSVVNWLLGRYLLHFSNRAWFPVSQTELDRAGGWFRRYGVWSLLFAWLPIIGDALTLIAGIMRVNFPLFFILTAVGKAVRYAILAGALYQLDGLAPFLGA